MVKEITAFEYGRTQVRHATIMKLHVFKVPKIKTVLIGALDIKFETVFLMTKLTATAFFFGIDYFSKTESFLKAQRIFSIL